MQKEQKAILDAIDILIDKKLKNLGFNYYINGTIQAINDDGTYDVKSTDTVFKGLSAKNNEIYCIGDAIQILVKNGDFSKKFIDGKLKPDGLAVSPYVLNLNQRKSEILQSNNGEVNLNDYTTCGCYGFNIGNGFNFPTKYGGILDVFYSRGNSEYGGKLASGITEINIPMIQRYTDEVGSIYYRTMKWNIITKRWVFGSWRKIVSVTNTVSDYIVSQGTSTQSDVTWYYRKWNSGIAECWGTYTAEIASVKEHWGSLYVSALNESRISYPFSFAERPIEQVNVHGNIPAIFAYSESGGNGLNTNTQTAKYCIASGSSSSSSFTCNLDLYVIGKYK